MSKVSNKAFAAIVGAIVIVGLAVILIFSFTNREIVATVGDSKITKDELYDKLVEQGGSNILSQMIDAEIINQEAKKEKIYRK